MNGKGRRLERWKRVHGPRGWGSGTHELFMIRSGLSETHFAILGTSSEALGVRGSGESGVRPIAQLDLVSWLWWSSIRFACWLVVSTSMCFCSGGERTRLHSGSQATGRAGGQLGMRRLMW
jgi:hypothetical protein